MKQLAVEGPADSFRMVSDRASGDYRQLVATPEPLVSVGKIVMGFMCALICGMLLIPLGALAQEFRATISGKVVDPSGAVVPGAGILVRETGTGAISKTVSASDGQYVVPFLAPGNYSITVTKAGFSTLSRRGLVLQAQEHPIIDLALAVGSISDTVTVTAETPLLNQENANVGDVISTESVASLPLNGYAPVMLAQLSVGVLTTSPPGQTTAYDPGSLNSWSIGGTLTNESEILLDGAADNQMSGAANGGAAFVPTEDSVQEVSVQTFSTDASIGHTTGGAINQVTKGGTNRLHGTGYEFRQFSGLAGNLFFNGASNTPKPVANYDQYGFTVGGPILIPKVYNGRNKLFFFFAWEGIRTVMPVSTIITVPTDAEKQGDFSALLAGGASYQLYEPNTGTLVNGQFTRTPVPNNCLAAITTYCKSVANAGITIDAVAAAYLKLYPEPNNTTNVSPITNQGNYNSNAPNSVNYSTEFGRLDYNLSSRDHIFFDMRHNASVNGGQDYLGNNTTDSNLFRGSYGAVVDNVLTINPTTVFDVRLNWGYFNEVHGTPTQIYSPTSVGLPASLTSASNFVALPNIVFNSNSFENLGDLKTPNIDPSNVYQAFTDVVKSLGRHTLKAGFDGRTYRQKLQTYTASSGSFTFANSFVTAGTGASAQPFGGDLATFEYGLPTAGSFGLNALSDYRSYYAAVFMQDDWRVNSHLTLNMGLRYDVDTPYGEKFGRTESGFDPNAVNSASTPAAAAFAPRSITKNNTTVTVSSINTLGGLTFPSSTWGAPYKIQNNRGFFSPRLGFSYNPAWAPKTALRGGFGIFLLPQSLQGATYSAGFSSTTSYAATNNSYFANLSTLDNPFPNGFTQPAGSSQGASTFLGAPSTISFFSPLQHDQYSVRWTLGVQHSITHSTLVEAIYEGNHGVHLPVASQNINAVRLQYLTTAPYRNQNLATALSTAVPNPFAGLLPLNSSYNGATTALSNLTTPFPAYGAGTINRISQSNGQSFYNSGAVHLEQRSKFGMTLTANYMFSKTIEQDTYLNPEDTTLLRGISPNVDHTHHFVLGMVYELPFGRGKMFNIGHSRVVEEIIGGWGVNAIYEFQSGLPIKFSTDIPFQPGESYKNITVNSRSTSAGVTDRAIPNAATVFVTGSSTSCTVAASQPCDGTVFLNGQYANHYRTTPITISSVRADGYNNLDASILKNFKFTEKTYLQYRFETFNTLNHPTFSAPNVSSATASNFGQITGVSNDPRQIQMGLRFVF